MILNGKGAQINTPNTFDSSFLSIDDKDGLDEAYYENTIETKVYLESPKSIISFNKSPDLNFDASINPYQGCEHGCTYCYARNSHEYWGFSAGLDFESKIIVKRNAPKLLEEALLKKNWQPKVIMLSGNTDCYQPLERKYKITRELLKVFLKYQHPVGIITKNALVERDIDILKELAKNNLVQVLISITSLNEELRRNLEPRTSTSQRKQKAIENLKEAGIPTGLMLAPIIPGLNHHEIPEILKVGAKHGASFASYSVVRLNGQIGEIFKDWLIKNYKDRKDKVWNQIKSLHHDQVNESEFIKRQRGEGQLAKIINQVFEINRNKYFPNSKPPQYNYDAFLKGGNLRLF